MQLRERGLTTEYLHDLLKEMIFGWKLAPGAKININHLARELNVSPIPLREALSRLQSTNLVVFEPNKGYRVSDILDRESMNQMFEARLLIESHAVRTVIRRGDRDIVRELASLNEKLSRIDTKSSYSEVLAFNQLDHLFHRTLVERCGNPFLLEAYEGMHCHLHIARFYHLRGEVDQKEAAEEHREIIEAVATRDVYRAEEAVAGHIREVGKRLLQE